MNPENTRRKSRSQLVSRALRFSRGSVRLPFPAWFHDYQSQWLRPDILGGLAVAAVVIPKALAYATIAGLPIQVGLYTALAPMLLYALL